VDVWKTVPKYPLFDNHGNAFLRAILAMALGADVNPGGIRGFGASMAMKMLSAAKNKNGDGDVDINLLITNS
jgi:hypothetical protein